jgi:aminoglycoside 3-N-acetyltransferase
VLSFRDLTTGFRNLDIDPDKPVIVHASLSSFGEIRGGADTLLGSLLANFQSLIMPTFTYKSMITPERGPENNGIIYGSSYSQNRMAEFFTPDMPCDRMMGILPETIRIHPKATRSSHPILSFAAINLDQAIALQSIREPLAPIRFLYEQEGYVLLLGVDHTVNTSIHFAEKLAGRKTFIRWALTPNGIVECANFPSCSEGFNKTENLLNDLTQSMRLGEAEIRCLAIKPMIERLCNQIKIDPLAFLCDKEECPRCEEIRRLNRRL